jgi:glyceraldehyde-3-phosphate dehydrogenase (NAD(P))
MTRTSVAVIGAGVIGKRMIHALAEHDGLQLVGTVVRGENSFVLARPAFPWFALNADAAARLSDAGVPVRGSVSDLLAQADVVMDCGPARSGATRRELYRRADIKAVYCGGERDAGLGPLVHPALNASAAIGATAVRLASCNTTALARTVAALGDVDELDATVVRCATDTDKAGKGITNGVVFGHEHSHHASDLADVVPGLTARSVALTAPMTSGHIIHVRLTLRGDGTSAALDLAAAQSRIELRRERRAVPTAVMRYGRDGPWHNRYRLVVQPIDSTAIGSRRLDLWLYLDNQAITVPEALDVLQLVGGEPEPEQARSRTDRALGLAAGVREQLGEVSR